MDQPVATPYPPPQFVMMPVPQRNGLGVFAFFVALIGLFIPTGVIALLGLMLGLAAIGRAPRGFATFGVILGLLGTIFWFVFMLVVVAVGLIGIVAASIIGVGAFLLTQPEVVEVTTDMVNVAIATETYEQENDRLPDGLDALRLGVATTIDPWGATYRFERADGEPGFDVVSSGPDGTFETADDVRLSGLDRFWEHALENFDTKMEELGRKLEHLEHVEYEYGCREQDERPGGADYEHEARRQITAEDRDADHTRKAGNPGS